MSPAGLLHATAHDHAAVLHKGRRIAAELAGEACDPGSDLTMVDRLALATLSLAVDIEASRRAGVEPCTVQAHAWLAEIERAAPSPTSFRPRPRSAHPEAIVMLPDILRWAALAAITAAVLRLPRPLGFWSHEVGRPLVLARVHPDGPSRIQQTAD
ncbi:MAG: hypothetical protein ACRYHQ_10645 [Janthinobacterium lividum]